MVVRAALGGLALALWAAAAAAAEDGLAAVAAGEGIPAAAAAVDAAARQRLIETYPDLARPSRSRERPRFLLFVSRSLPEATMREALALASQNREVALVYRGLPPGGSLKTFVKAVAAVADRYAPLPAILIDPPAFRSYGIASVPAIVDTATGRLASGWLDPGYLTNRDEPPPAEPLGPTYPIDEPDLAHVLQARAAALDLEHRARSSVERFWRKLRLPELPAAVRTETRTVDPAMITANDLADADGAVILPAGSRLSPHEHLPLTTRLVVFDARIPAQVSWASAQPKADRPVAFLVAGFDASEGWDGWDRLRRRIAGPTYLLTPELVQRLRLRATPSIITGDGERIRVSELAPPFEPILTEAESVP